MISNLKLRNQYNRTNGMSGRSARQVRAAFSRARNFSTSCRVRSLMCLVAGVLGLPIGFAQETKPAPAGTLCVMTYDIRFGSFVAPNSWAQRRPMMRELIKKILPDVMGTQEG